MVNKKFMLGMLVLVLAFGLTVIACDSDSNGGGGGDPALNGTWVSPGESITLDNGSFTANAGGSPYMRGTYNTSGSNMTITPTDYHSNALAEFEMPFPSGWYSRSQLASLFEGAPQAYIDMVLDMMYAPITGTYSLSGNTLTITMAMPGEQATTTTYTRQ